MAEEIEMLLSVKFPWILFSSLKGEVENVLAKSGTGTAILFSDRPKNKLGSGIRILIPFKFRWILFSSFWEEYKNVSANQRSGPSSFSDQPKKKKHKYGRGR